MTFERNPGSRTPVRSREGRSRPRPSLRAVRVSHRMLHVETNRLDKRCIVDSAEVDADTIASSEPKIGDVSRPR